jgi:hypothetical protein
MLARVARDSASSLVQEVVEDASDRSFFQISATCSRVVAKEPELSIT